MKKYLFVLVITSLFGNSFAQSGWQVQYSGESFEWYTDIFFLNSNTGWAVDYGGGKLLKTTNRGTNWISVPNSILSKTGIAFYNESTGWICGSGGQLYKTINSGINWIRTPNCNCNSSQDDFNDIQFINEYTGWAYGDTRIHKTTDGGMSYFTQTTPLNAWNGWFIDSLRGWVVGYGGYNIAKTTDGGNVWDTVPSPGYTHNYAISFINDLTGWVSGNGKIFKTTNAGGNWNEQIAGVNISTEMYKMQFVDMNNGWIACTNGILLKTSNGGENWFRQVTGVSDDFWAIFMLNSQEGWISGKGGKIFHTTDGGGPPVGINPISSEIPTKFSLSQNYPNPFNPTTKIKFEIPKNAFVKLVVYDSAGKEVEILTDELVQAGEYEAEFNAANYPSGVYYYKFSTGDFTATKKMILLK